MGWCRWIVSTFGPSRLLSFSYLDHRTFQAEPTKVRPSPLAFAMHEQPHSQIGKIAHLFQILCTCEQFTDMQRVIKSVQRAGVWKNYAAHGRLFL